MCEAFARGDWAAAIAPMHTDIEWNASENYPWPDADVFRGRDGVLDFFRRFLGTWDEYHAHFEEFIDAGDAVIAIVSERGRGRGSGVEVSRSFAQVWVVRDGQAVAFTAYGDREAALAAVAGRGTSPGHPDPPA